jgi:glucose/arabinose dehydrogenase
MPVIAGARAMRKMIVVLLFGMAAVIGSGRAHAQPAPDPKVPSGAPVLAGTAAFGDWRSDAPGVGRLITPADLPAPYASPSARNSASVVRPPATAALKVPPGFAVQRFASGLRNPRVVRVAPNGDIFVAETAAGRIRVLRAVAGAAQPDRTEIFADRLDRPFGIAFYPPGSDPRWIYVAENNAVVRYPYEPGDLTARAPAEALVPELAGTRSGHATRDLAIASDGRRIFVSVGSGSNVGEGMPRKSPDEIRSWEAAEGLGAAWGNETHRADVLTFDPDGKNLRVFAAGIRNCVGLAVQPQTGDLWCATNERDGLGDNLVPDYVTRVRAGAFYGWPWWYIGHQRGAAACRRAAGSARQGDRPGCPAGIAFGSHGDDVLSAVGDRRSGVPGRLSGRRLCRAAWLVEPPHAHRLQGGAHSAPRRRADRRLRGFLDRLRGRRRRCLGPAGRRRDCARRCAAGQRRRQRHDLARGI